MGEPRPDAFPALQEAQAIDGSRRRARARLLGRERIVTLAISSSFVAAALALALSASPVGHPELWVSAVFLTAYAVVSRVEFEVGQGSAVPTELILIPMLFVLPPTIVPLYVAAGLVAGSVIDVAVRQLHHARLVVLLGSSWHAVGPALVVWQLAPGPPRWDAVPVYALALAAQFAFDAMATAGRQWLGLGVAPRDLLRPLGWTFLVDALLAPVGLIAAFLASTTPLAVVSVLPLVVLLHLFSMDRSAGIDRRLELGRAVEHAAHQARTDALTGVRNRRAWQEALAAAEAALREHDTPFTVALLDVDGLKEANDTRGHAFGDELLQEIAGILRRTIRGGDLVARIGGDEFGILISGWEAPRRADLVGRLADAFAAHPDGMTLSASMGVAMAPPARSAAEALLEADERLYENKALARRARAAVR